MKKRFGKPALWFLMFCKRLLHKPGFLILLVLIPLTVISIRLGVSDDSGVLRIGLYSENTATGREIVKKLTEKDSIIAFEVFESEEDARQAVLTDRIQGAWIFPEDLEEKIDKNARIGTLKPLVKVIEREESIPLQLSHEILYGTLHPYVTYSNYKNFIIKKYGDTHTPTEEKLLKSYNDGTESGAILEIRVLGEKEEATITTDFLAFPLRGILALLTVLCGLASTMFFLDDKRNGKFDWLAPSQHIIPAYDSCLAGTVLSGCAVLVSLPLAGVWTGFVAEIISLTVYIVCVCNFCLICGLLAGNVTRLGALTPFIMIIMLVLCPIFLDMGIKLSILLPPSYYLNAPYNVSHLGHMIIYAVCSFAVLLCLNSILGRRPAKSTK